MLLPARARRNEPVTPEAMVMLRRAAISVGRLSLSSRLSSLKSSGTTSCTVEAGTSMSAGICVSAEAAVGGTG
jgi:hypothetical protein